MKFRLYTLSIAASSLLISQISVHGWPPQPYFKFNKRIHECIRVLPRGRICCTMLVTITLLDWMNWGEPCVCMYACECVWVLTVSWSTLTRVPPPRAMLSTSGMEKLVLTSPPTYSIKNTSIHGHSIFNFYVFFYCSTCVRIKSRLKWYPLDNNIIIAHWQLGYVPVYCGDYPSHMYVYYMYVSQ